MAPILRGLLLGGVQLILSSGAATPSSSGKVALTLKKADSRQSKLSPSVDGADKKFFGKDYPYDNRPNAKHAFDYPYPAVQDSEDYMTDYVKDENSDGGHWAAQMEYDTLRTAIGEKKREVQKALEAKEAAKKELDEAIANEAAAEGRSISAEGAAEAAEEDVKKADSAAGDGEGKIDGASSNTESKTDALEECQKELQKARKQLKELEEEKKKRDAASKAAQSEAETEAEKEAESAAEKETEAEAAASAADKKALSVEQRVTVTQKEYLASQTLTAKWQEKVYKTEDELKVAKAKVKALRRDTDEVDPDGGVYRTTRSGSGRNAHTQVFWVAILAASFRLFL